MPRLHHQGLVVAASALVTLTGAAGVQAEEGRVAFSVRRSASAGSCPDVRGLAAAVSHLTAKVTLDPDVTDAADGRIEVEFSRGPSRFRAHLRATGLRSGVRVLVHDGVDCAPLAEATAISLAVLLDPEWRPPEPAPTLPPPPPVPAPKDAPNEPAVPPPPAEATASGWGLRAHATAGAAIGVLRSAAPVLGVGVAVDPIPALSFSGGAALIPAQSLPLAPGHVDVALAGGEAAACVLPLGSARARVGGCASAVLAVVSASGVGYFRNGSTSRPWLAFGGHAYAHGEMVGPLGWTARAGALAPTTTEAFGVDGAGVAYAPPRVAIVLAAGLTMTFR